MSDSNLELDDLDRNLPESDEAILTTVLERASLLRIQGFRSEVPERLKSLRKSCIERAEIWLALKLTEAILAFLAEDLCSDEYEKELEFLGSFAGIDLAPMLLKLEPDLSSEQAQLKSAMLKAQITDFVQKQKVNAGTYFERELMIRNRALAAELSSNLRALQMSVETFASENGAYPESLDDSVYKEAGCMPAGRLNPYTGAQQTYRSRSLSSKVSDELLFSEKLPQGLIEYLYLEDLKAYVIRAACCHSEFAYASISAVDFVSERLLKADISD